MKARINEIADTELYREYMAMTLYAISNSYKMTKTLADIKNSVVPQEQKKVDAKATADAVAQRMGTKINWGK